MLGGASNSEPLQVQTLVSLLGEPFNFNEKAFRFNLTTFGGDRYICLKAPPSAQDEDPQVGIVDMYDDFNLERRSTRKADGAMKHPVEEILVLRGHNEAAAGGPAVGQFIQVFDLKTKTRLGEHAFANDICYWRWLYERTLVLVSGDEVYHWEIRESSDAPETVPKLIMRREGRLKSPDIQVINYSVDHPAAPQWVLLAGIYLDDTKQVKGCLQLYCVEKNQCQFLEGYAGCFGALRTDSELSPPTQFFAFIEKKGGAETPMKLYVMDIYSARGEGHPTPFKVVKEFTYPSQFASDFPIGAHFSKRHGVIYTASKNGHAMVFDAMTATRIHTQRVSTDGLFLTQSDNLTGGMKVINRKGLVLRVAVNEFGLIKFMKQTLGDQVAMSLARRYGYPEADEYLMTTFRQHFQNQNYSAAAALCALSKSTCIRNRNTMNSFKTAKANVGEPSATLQYFTALLDLPGRLTNEESIELCRPAVTQRKLNLVADWIHQDRLECSEALGDLVYTVDPALALIVYQRANCHSKVIRSYGEANQFTKLLYYIKRKNYQADFTQIIRSIMATNPDSAADFVKNLLDNKPPLIDALTAFNLFVQNNKLREITGIFCQLLKSGHVEFPDQADLETRVLEANIAADPNTAELIFQQGALTRFDRHRIAQISEKAGLYRRALECYTDVTDVKRVLNRCGGQLSPEWLSQFCDGLQPLAIKEILSDMIRTNRSNLNAVVQMARNYYERLGVENVIEMFEVTNSLEGLYMFTGSILSVSTNPDVHYKYIMAAAKLGHWQECERVVRESKFYDPVKVRDLLKNMDFSEPRAFIFVCDIHGYIEELTETLYRNDKMDFLEVYVTRVNMANTPTVISVLLDVGCPQDVIVQMLQQVRGACPIEPLVTEMDKRGCLQLILPWMEDRIAEGAIDECLNNAVAKVYIDTNKDTANFLENNPYYNAKVIGQYCENKDPHMAVAAYMKGNCDMELIELANKNGLYRVLAKYVLQRESDQLWDTVLDESNVEHRQHVLDQLMATALVEAKSAAEIVCAIRALARAQLQNALLDLLERVILQRAVPDEIAGEIINSSKLQNLLLLTAMQVDREKSRDFINKLDKIDAHQAAEAALAQGEMDEEALAIYEKHGMNLEAVSVMLDRMHNIQAAEAFGERIDDPAVWTKIGEYCLEKADHEHLAGAAADAAVYCRRAMDVYTKVERCPNIRRIIDAAKKTGELENLVVFLKYWRSAANADFSTDTDLAYALAKTGQHSALETFLSGTNTVNCQKLGDQLFDEASHEEAHHEDVSSDFVSADDNGLSEKAAECYRLAKIFYTRIPNHAKIAACHVRLGDHAAAVEAAKKAGSSKSWVDVALASIAAGDWVVAQSSAAHVIEYSDHLEKIVEAYEEHGRYEDLIALLENGTKSGKQNIQLLSELGICYAKYAPHKLEDYLSSSLVTGNAKPGTTKHIGSTARLNVPRLIKVCEAEQLWPSVVLLYLSYSEYDQALTTILAHPETCWNPARVVQILGGVTNKDLVYRTVSYYIDEHADLLNDLLLQLEMPMNYQRLIQTIKTHRRQLESPNLSVSVLGLMKAYFEHEQAKANENTSVVNDILHDIYIDSHDVEALKKSITSFGNFDQSALAKRLEQHELLGMKQLALMLYKEDSKYSHAIGLAKKFKQYAEAIAIAIQSQDRQVAEDLLRFFVEDLKNPHYFSACLQLCSNVIRPETALELAWVHGMVQEVMPYMIQTIKHLNGRIEVLEKKVTDNKKLSSKSSNLGSSPVPMLPYSPILM